MGIGCWRHRSFSASQAASHLDLVPQVSLPSNTQHMHGKLHSNPVLCFVLYASQAASHHASAAGSTFSIKFSARATLAGQYGPPSTVTRTLVVLVECRPGEVRLVEDLLCAAAAAAAAAAASNQDLPQMAQVAFQA